MSIEFCPKCQSPRNMLLSAAVREQTHSDGEIKKILTRNYQCEVCHSFVRSEELEVTDEDSGGEAATTDGAGN
ncbi:MAG: hypothetical protein AABN34_23755 [Acidobacteriota bacterium]